MPTSIGGPSSSWPLAGGRATFGCSAVARGEDTEAGDVDLLVDLDEGVGLVSLAGLKRELTALLGAEVNVVPVATLKPRMRVAVLAEAVAL